MPAKLSKTQLSPFSSYQEYVSRLQMLMEDTGRGTEWDKQVFAALNGQAVVELQRLVSLEARRKYGAYFTGTKLSEQMLAKCAFQIGERTFYDAACGMGDLLLAAAKKLPLAATLSETLIQWGEKLAGTDLHAEFIEGAKIRLVLLAYYRHQTTETLDGSLDDFFPQIQVGDGLVEENAFQRAMTILLNPPFGIVESPDDCTWAGGRISEAAMFIVTALERSQPGTELLAILPEVLRSGSFSALWRERVSELAEVHLVEPYGIFDESADVDVFILRLVRRAEDSPSRRKQWPAHITTRSTTVADYFDVHVGRVVPHRDPEQGPEYPYIHPRSMPIWTVMRDFDEMRRHEAVAYQAPFVAIRRTSRPGHPYRATATVIAGRQIIAVENHVIVCIPQDRTLKSCLELMRQLKTSATNDFLNKRIRCRHLTVGSVEEIPFKPKAARDT
jgi:hypothetical protein